MDVAVRARKGDAHVSRSARLMSTARAQRRKERKACAKKDECQLSPVQPASRFFAIPLHLCAFAVDVWPQMPSPGHDQGYRIRRCRKLHEKGVHNQWVM